MSTLLLLLSSAALGAPPTDASVSEAIAALAPTVEARAGRAFALLPSGGVVRRAELLGALTRLSAERGGTVSGLEEAQIAVYVPALDGVFVIEEAFSALAGELGASPAVDALLRCVLAHELVHALQHQYGVLDTDDPDLRAGARALREGHASLVGEAWCAEREGEAIASLAVSISGTDIALALPPDDPHAPYARGRALAVELGDEVWSALVGPPPSWAVLAEGWRGPSGAQPLRAALDRLGLPVDRVEAVGPGRFLPLLVGLVPGEVPVPLGRSGWLASGDGGQTIAAIFRMAEPGAPAAAVDGRLWTVARGDPPAVLLPRITLRARLRGHRTSGGGVVAGATDRGPYREVWLADGETLAIVASLGARPSARAISGALAPLVAGAPELEGPREALGPWLAEVRARRTPPIPSWQFRLHRAEIARQAGAPYPCRDAFAALLAPGALEAPEPYARAAYRCGAETGEREILSAALPCLDRLEHRPAVLHAGLLIDEGDDEGALAILDRAVPDPRYADALAEMRLSLLARLGRQERPGAGAP